MQSSGKIELQHMIVWFECKLNSQQTLHIMCSPISSCHLQIDYHKFNPNSSQMQSLSLPSDSRVPSATVAAMANKIGQNTFHVSFWGQGNSRTILTHDLYQLCTNPFVQQNQVPFLYWNWKRAFGFSPMKGHHHTMCSHFTILSWHHPRTRRISQLIRYSRITS
jgi:hypothetical protein